MEFSPKKATTTKKCCSVPQCSSLAERDRTLSFHTFPKENETVRIGDVFGNYAATGRREEWARLLKIGKPVSKCMYVCSKHFTADNFKFPDIPAQKRYLKFDAIPSENLPQSPTRGLDVHKTRRLDRRKKILPETSSDSVPHRSMDDEKDEPYGLKSRRAQQVEVKAELPEEWDPPAPIVFVKTEVTDDDYGGICQPATGLDLISTSSYSATMNLGRDAATKSEADRPDFRFIDVDQTLPTPSSSGRPADVDPLELPGTSLPEPSIKQEHPDDTRAYPLVPTPHGMPTDGLREETPTDRGVASLSPGSRLTCGPVIVTTTNIEYCRQETHESADEPNGKETLAFETGNDEATSRLPSQAEDLCVNMGLGSTEHASSEDVSIQTSGGKQKDVKFTAGSPEQNDAVDGKPRGCEQSDETYQLASHKLVHTGATRFGCRFCAAGFARSSNLVVHLRSHTGEKPFACNVCRARYTRRISLTRHKRTHTEEKHYSCNSCEVSFTHRSDLVKHKGTHARVKHHACDICQARFSRNSNLNKHKQIHTGEKPYACDSCEARFSHQFYLTQHKRTHTGEKPFACDACDANFSQGAHLLRHRRVHTGEKPYACDACDVRFSDARSLQRHRASRHSTTPRHRPHHCIECTSTFATNWELSRHSRSHPGKVPYSCEVCHARFTEGSGLTNHRRFHRHAKTYSCDMCNATFTQGSNLAIHKRLHVAAKPYICDLCQAKFSDRRTLKTHIMSHGTG